MANIDQSSRLMDRRSFLLRGAAVGAGPSARAAEGGQVNFINAYLEANGAGPINLDKFGTLPSSKATGARQIGRLTNLMELTVDTSWWTHSRSDSTNPDLGGTLPQAVPELASEAKFLTAMGLFRGQSPEFFAGVTALAQAADATQRQ